LKAGLEALSGLDLSDVRVHHNSAKPAPLNALAYTQGQDIELGPGQEHNLPHEGWHAVQQRQGRVQPTMQVKGKVSVNDDVGLEHEADEMGARALKMGQDLSSLQQGDAPKSQWGQGLVRNRLTQVMQQNRGQCIQRRLLDPDDETFKESIERDFPHHRRSRNLSNLISKVKASQKALDRLGRYANAEDRQTALDQLLELQKQMEKWRDKDPKEYANRGTRWPDLNQEVKARIEELTRDMLQEKPATTGEQLANAKKTELTSLAMRIVVENAQHYYPRFASKLATDRREKHVPGPAKTGLRMPNPLTGRYSEQAVGMTERQVEDFGAGVCNEFAQTAAAKLKGHGVRVEIMSSKLQGHTFVVLGRAPGTELRDYRTWGDTCVVVDCWWGAIKWGTYDEFPQVIFSPARHIGQLHNTPERVDYDSL
jgi:hypothetical protein